MSYGAIEAAFAEDLGKEAEINQRARKLEAAVYDVDHQFGPFLAQAQDEDEFRDRISLCRKDILKVVGQHLPPVTGVMRRVISAQRAKWKKRACGEVVWSYGQDDPQESVAYPDEDTTLKVCPKGDGEDNLWEWDCKGGGHSGSGVTNSPDKARQDAEDCYRFGSRRTATDGTVRPEMDTDITFHPEDGNLIPEDNWEGYKDSVDQNGPEKVQRNFEPKQSGSHKVHYTNPGEFEEKSKDFDDEDQANDFHQFVRDSGGAAVTNRVSSLAFDIYEDFCSTNGLSRTASSSLEAYRENVNQAEFNEIVSILQQRTAGDFGYQEWHPQSGDRLTHDGDGGQIVGPVAGDRHAVQWDDGSRSVHTHRDLNDPAMGFRRAQKTAGGSGDEASLLDKANKALTDLLNNRAQAFQETLGPLQEALQAVMYAQQVQYQQSPMNVQSPAGTVDVMPQQQDPSGMMGQDPSMGGAPPLGGAPGALPAGLIPGDQVPGGMPVPPGEDR